MDTLWSGLGTWLLDYYLLASMLLLVVTGVMLLVRQPAWRVALGWSTIAGLFFLAVACAMPIWPRCNVPVMFSTDFEVDSSNSATNVAPTTTPSMSDQPSVDDGKESVLPDEEYIAEYHSSVSTHSDQGVSFAQQATSIAGVLFPLAFLVGAVSVTLWLIAGAILTTHLRSTARRAPEKIQTALSQLLGHRPTWTLVFVSDRINQALAVGVLQPRIILPERFEGDESNEALAAVLAHESAHVRNGDLLMLAGMRLLMPLLFAHPLYWWLRARLRMDQELLADAAAGQQGDVANYAEILLNWFRTNDSNRARLLTATLGLWERPHLLKRRIAMLLNERFRVVTSAPATWQITSWLLLMTVVASLSVFTLRSQPAVVAQERNTPQVPSDEQAKPAAPASENIKAKETEKPKATETVVNDTKYQSADEAWRVGVAFYNSRNYAASQEPFEAALKLAPNDDFRLKVYDALRASYRMLSMFDKMVDACDFIIRHSRTSSAKRSLTRRDLLGFVYQRGKTDVLINRYEKELKGDPKSRTALYMLSEAYDRIKNDPKRAAELTERLLALNGDGKKTDVSTSAKLAMQYVRQKKYQDGAALYEKIAPLDERLAAWHWKEAATAWLKIDENGKALAAAKQAAKIGPDTRSQQLTHYWHRHIGEVFLATGEAKLAIEHLEKAIENTTIEGYVNDCRTLLTQARRKAGLAD